MREIGYIFVDENLLPVGRALDEVGNALYPGHPDVPRLPTGASDVAIFDEVGANGRDLVLFTRDNRIRRRSSELYRFRQAGVRAVILTGKRDLKPRETCFSSSPTGTKSRGWRRRWDRGRGPSA